MTETPTRWIDLTFLRGRDARKRIAVLTASFAVVAAAYSLLAPKWYRSVLTVAPGKAQKGTGLAGLIGGELGSLTAGFDSALSGGADSARIAAVLKSNAVTDAVIEKFGLRDRYDVRFQESARDALWQHCTVKTLPKPNLVELSCEDKDPRLVQEILRYFAEYGNEVFRRVSVSSASEEVRFLERRVTELKRQADDAANRIRAFQEQHQIVDLDSQAKAVVSSLATLHSQRIARQMELDYAGGFSSADEAGRRQLESQIAVVDSQLRDLEDPSGPQSTGRPAATTKKRAGSTMFPAALAVPKLRSEYETLYRDRKVAEATLVFALDRLEGAKAAEARDVSTFVVLDPPALPTRKARPRTTDNVIVAAAAGFLIAVLFSWWKATRAENGKAPAIAKAI